MLILSTAIHFTILLWSKVNKNKNKKYRKYKNLNTGYTYPDVTLHSWLKFLFSCLHLLINSECLFNKIIWKLNDW